MNWMIKADAIIQRAEQILAGQVAIENNTIDTDGMSEIGKHTFGQVGQFNISKETAARGILRDGYREFTSHISRMGTNHPEFSEASQAQDRISDAYERIFKTEL